MGAAASAFRRKKEKQEPEAPPIPDEYRPQTKEVGFIASHPDWPKNDFITIGKPSKGEYAGRFYSANKQFVGRWQIQSNTLALSWDKERPIDYVRAGKTEEFWFNDQTKLTLKLQSPSILPLWLAPSVLGRKFDLIKTCEKHFECPICYFDLPIATPCVVRDRKRRVCPHYFHHECANRVLAKRHTVTPVCPECGAKFSDAKEIPSMIDDPRGWFQTCDADLSGSLDKEEIVNALGSMLLVDREKLQKTIDLNWSMWDPSGDGDIDVDEFLRPEDGLREFIIRNFADFKKPAFDISQVPLMETHPVQWFEYWDRDGGGTLDREEFTRAMVKTFCVNVWGDPVLSRAQETRELGGMIWRNQGLHEFDAISFEDFIKPYGLYDTLVHNVVQGTFFGEEENGT